MILVLLSGTLSLKPRAISFSYHTSFLHSVSYNASPVYVSHNNQTWLVLIPLLIQYTLFYYSYRAYIFLEPPLGRRLRTPVLQLFYTPSVSCLPQSSGVVTSVKHFQSDKSNPWEGTVTRSAFRVQTEAQCFSLGCDKFVSNCGLNPYNI